MNSEPTTDPELPLKELDEERAEYKRVLESGFFDRAPILSRLLSYLCEKYFEGSSQEIKETTIAIEVFHRTVDFDSRHDTIVRVNVNRLRDALTRFYKKEGKDHRLQITIPSGQYVPVFKRVRPAQTTFPEKSSQSSIPQAGTLTPHHELEVIHEISIPLPEGVIDAPLPASGIRDRRLMFCAGALCGLGLALLSWFILREVWMSPPQVASQVTPAGTGRFWAQIADPGIRILAGSNVVSALDWAGREWRADRFFKGGSARQLSQVATPSGFPVFQARREGDFSYDIPLPPGVYQLQLYFIETESGIAESNRVFDVEANGQPILREFDVVADAGGGRFPTIRVFKDIAPAADGCLHLRFAGRRVPAILSGLEILPGISGKMLPLRMTAQPTYYLSPEGVLWEPDHYSWGGQIVHRQKPVSGVLDPQLFRTEHFGNFHYIIPVPPGQYQVNLYFAETFFGPSNPGGRGSGIRHFNVFCNGQVLLRNFDIFQDAGGENRSILKTFHGLEPNAQGKLNLDFVPIGNLASLCALEVLPE